MKPVYKHIDLVTITPLASRSYADTVPIVLPEGATTSIAIIENSIPRVQLRRGDSVALGKQLSFLVSRKHLKSEQEPTAQ